jgi:hypothetical protein
MQKSFKNYILNPEKIKFKELFINIFPDFNINTLPKKGSFKIYHDYILKNEGIDQEKLIRFTSQVWNPYFQWYILGEEYI